MAWTTPRTWTDGELVTAAIMNPHIRDNMNTLEHLVARKASDETVASSIVVQADNDLIVPVGASDVWSSFWQLGVTGAPGDFRFGWTFPASGTVYGMYLTFDGTNTVQNTFYDTSSPTSEFTTVVASDTNIQLVTVWMTYVGGGTSGNVTLQWAQVTSNASATTVKANSFVRGLKLA